MQLLRWHVHNPIYTNLSVKKCYQTKNDEDNCV